MTELKSFSFDQLGRLLMLPLAELQLGILRRDGGWSARWNWCRKLSDRGPVNALRFTADGKYLMTGGGEPSREGKLKFGLEGWTLRARIQNIHSDSVFALDLSPDG